jgi:ABC-type Mn2+/Zn2+ transport system permease subunit
MFEPVFMRLALAACVATGVSLGLMGVYLAIRRVVFIGLVLANAAALGSALAQIFGWPPELASVFLAAATALALGALQSPRRVSTEALMGWSYAAASSATVLLLARAAAADADTLHLLFGNLLAISATHTASLVLVAVVIIVLHVLFRRRFLLVTFDIEAASVAGVNTTFWSMSLNLLIGCAAAMAVHEIGALLTFSLLTLPAMGALLATSSIRGTFVSAAVLGGVLPCLGLATSFYFDLPAGPASVALLVISVPVAALVRSRRKATLGDAANSGETNSATTQAGGMRDPRMPRAE